MSHTLGDFRGALRTLVHAPVFAITAILSIAIGVGANTAIFSVASALLLRPLPYRDADRLVILWNRSPGIGVAEDWFSTAQYFDVVRRHGGFDTVAIAIGANWNLTGDGEPERIGAIILSALVAHTAWHWMIERGDRVRQFDFVWPALDGALLASVLRWAILGVILAGLFWLVRLARRRPARA